MASSGINIKIADLEIYRGDDTIFNFIVTDEKNQPIDFNNDKITCLIKSKKTNYLLSIGQGIVVNNNTVSLILSHELTKDWDFSVALYDIQVIDANNIHKTIARGKITITMDITP